MKISGKISCAVLFAIIAGCGGNGGDGYISLKIENAYGPEGVEIPKMYRVSSVTTIKTETSALSEPLEVVQFKVTVSGPGIAEPISETAEPSSKKVRIMEIPEGGDRVMLIEAFNASGEVIRRRQIEGITISSGKIRSIDTSLDTVPVILNLKEGGIAMADGLHIVGFGEPGTSIKIESTSGSKTVNVSESVGGDIIISPSLSTGLFEFTPPPLPPGKQTITITDEGTGESSSRTVTVVATEGRAGMRITSGGEAGSFVSVGLGLGAERGGGGNIPLVFRSLGQLATTATEVVEETQ